MRESWGEDKLKEWKAGWKAKTAHWKKKKGVAEPEAPHYHNKRERAIGKIAGFLNKNRAPEVEAEPEVQAPPKRKRKTEAERLQTTLMYV